MAFERLTPLVQVDDNILTISFNDKIQEDSVYEIKISGLKSSDGTKIFPNQTVSVITAGTPMYCSLSELKSFTNVFGVSDEDMTILIRKASAFADFIEAGTSTMSTSTSSTVLFAKKMFTQYQAAVDCLIGGFVSGAFSSMGNRYKLGEDEIEEGDRAAALKNLLDWLKYWLKYWMDAIRGYFNEGRAKPKASRFGISASDNQDVSYITVDSLIQDFTRDVPQWN